MLFTVGKLKSYTLKSSAVQKCTQIGTLIIVFKVESPDERDGHEETLPTKVTSYLSPTCSPFTCL
jgi:hypothetical protein